MRRLPGLLFRSCGIGFVVFTAGLGCVFDASGLPPSGLRLDCTSTIKDCLPRTKIPVVSVVAPATACYAARFDLQLQSAGNSKGIYCDKNWVVSEFSSPLENPAKGATWIRAAAGDADRPGVYGSPSAAEFLKIHWQKLSKPVSVYVAYDSRATTKPSWLRPPEYKPALDSQGKPFTISVTLPVIAPGPVKLELFEKVNPPSAPTAANPFVVPGNLHGNPSGWPAKATKAMYLVLVKAQPELDLSSCSASTTAPRKLEDCFKDSTAAMAAADKACADWLTTDGQPNQICEPATCQFKDICPEGEIVSSTSGLKLAPINYSFHSLIEFGSQHAAKATIKADQTKQVRDVSGMLHFEYLLDSAGRMHEMRLNSMSLGFGSVPTDAGSFSNNKVSLLAPVTATCQGAYKPWATPCDSYQLAPLELAVSLSTKNNGKDKVFLAQNKGAVSISIDHAKRTLHILPGAKLTTQLVDGDTSVTVEIDIDLTGRFLNFAPKAIAGGEWVNGVECGSSWTGPDDRRPTFVSGNPQPVVLDAGESFEVYGDPLPSNAFRWYEDRGLGSQQELGTGEKLTLPAYRFSFGSHAMSLVARDSYGAFSTDDFPLWVVDTTPPSLNVPPTIYFLPRRPGPVTIDPGQATASDSCAEEVMVTNDAPAGNRFPSGALTKVTWTADDGHGNLTQRVQDVYVFAAVDLGTPWRIATQASRALSLLEQATDAHQQALESCLSNASCSAQPEALAEATRMVMGQLERAAESGRVDLLPIQERLSVAMEELQGSAAMLNEAAELQQRRAELISASMLAAERSANLVKESRELLAEIEEPPDD